MIFFIILFLLVKDSAIKLKATAGEDKRFVIYGNAVWKLVSLI